MRVQLVVTGDLEQLGLGASLQRMFRAAGHDVTFETPQKVHGMTGNPLPALSQERIPTAICKMATALVTNTLVKKRSDTPLPDMVIGVDDLELANLEQPDIVVGWLRRAVGAALEEQYPALPARERNAEALRERCSFHLVAPLIEAYFFGHAQALAAAGVPAATPTHLVSADLERFETSDPQFLSEAARINASHAADGRPWWREERHPKRYLEHLISRAGDSLYGETTSGLKALQVLNWSTVSGAGGPLPFIRALFEDLADLLGTQSLLGPGLSSQWTYPGRQVQAASRSLRNL